MNNCSELQCGTPLPRRRMGQTSSQTAAECVKEASWCLSFKFVTVTRKYKLYISIRIRAPGQTLGEIPGQGVGKAPTPWRPLEEMNHIIAKMLQMQNHLTPGQVYENPGLGPIIGDQSEKLIASPIPYIKNAWPEGPHGAHGAHGAHGPAPMY